MFNLGKRRKCTFGARSGGTTIETAVTLPLFVLFLFAFIEYSRYELLRQLVISASRTATRHGVVGGNQVTAADLDKFVRKRLAGQAPEQITINAYKCDAAGKNTGSWQSALAGDLVAIEVTAVYDVIIPSFGVLPDTLPIHHKTVMMREVN